MSGAGIIITMKTFSFKQSNKKSGTVSCNSKPDVRDVPLFYFPTKHLIQ